MPIYNRRAMIRGTIALTAWVLTRPFPAAAQEPGAASPSLPTATLWIETDRGRHAFAVELAQTPDARQIGLQGRRFLAADAGMLFDFGSPQPVSMWMKNTFLSLDMLFIDSEGTVVKVAEATPPLSLALIRSDRPVRAVLEVIAGTCARLGIGPGSRVHGAGPFRQPAAQ